MEWSLEYYSEDVEESILSLPDGLLARYRVFLLYYFKKQDLYAPYFYKKITKNSKKGIENCVFTIERGKKS
jgi:hypothetical protein